MFRTYLIMSLLGLAICHPLLAQEPNSANQQSKKDRLQQLDKNGDGMISQDEFLAQATARFKKMDSDGDGQLSKSELSAVRDKVQSAVDRKPQNNQFP